jgi:hypothetical protein
MEELEIREKEYRTSIAEKKERKPIKLATEIKGISKEELNSLNLQEEDKFRTV